MIDPVSPLGDAFRRGTFGNAGDAGPSVHLSETGFRSIAEIAAFPGHENAVPAVIRKAAGLTVTGNPGSGAVSEEKRAFNTAPGRFLVSAEKTGLVQDISDTLAREDGTVTDLSHGRTAIAIKGAAAEWTLSKLFAIDFSSQAFPVKSGLSTSHHGIFAQIHRTGADRFELYVFRSFARAFAHALSRAADESGYKVE